MDQGVQLDIFVFRNKDKRGKMLKAPDGYSTGDIRDLERDIIFPVKDGVFENIRVSIPHQVRTYSTRMWGGYPPPLPPVDKRYPHEGNIQILS